MLPRLLKTTYLGDYDGNRINNFTLLRLVLSFTVLFGHSFPITGNGHDPITKLILPHAWIGSIAVGGFFAISGFLVSASIANRSILDFTLSRIFRLYPAVIVYSLVAILIFGPLGSQVSLAKYFSENPWVNMWNATLWKWIYNLPYAFSDRPFPGSTNGATWTLPAELRCYLALAVFGMFRFYSTRGIANIALLATFIALKINYTSLPLFGSEPRFEEPLMFFIFGGFFWFNRQSIPLNWPVLMALMAATFFGAGQSWYFYAYVPAVTYGCLMISYRLPHCNIDQFGDISYGIYIYAWPVQQLVWSPGQGAYANTLFATLIVLPISYFSWRFIESPALNFKNRLMKGKAASRSLIKAT